MPNEPRILIVDPNIEGLKGHFLELALVIADAARNRGYSPWLVTSRGLPDDPSLTSGLTVLPTFSCEKIRRWSLGPHGYSRVCRDFDGKPIGGTPIMRAWQHCIDLLHGMTASRVMQHTVNELSGALASFRPQSQDQILFTTADDFVLLIATAALRTLKNVPPLNLAFLWHNPVRPGRACELWSKGTRQRETARQTDYCLSSLQGHRVKLLATTTELCSQYDLYIKAGIWRSIDYPIRDAFGPEAVVSTNRHHFNVPSKGVSPLGAAQAGASSQSLRAVCGGALRSEKGARSLSRAVRVLWNDFLSPGKLRLGLQMEINHVARLIPKKASPMTRPSDVAFPFDLAPSSLAIDAYLEWIRSADIGLFLYDSRRYYGRCSGVLIEMLACGKPVIVPAGCWLSRQIAKPNDEYLKNLGQTLPGGETPLAMTGTLLPKKPSALCEGVIDDHCEASLFTVFVGGATDQSYVAIEEAYCERNGDWQTHWHILELQNQCCRLLIRHHSPDGENRAPTRLRMWSPYGERGLKLLAVNRKRIECDARPAAAIGVTFARIDDLTSCFQELQNHYESFCEAVLKHHKLWKAKHSGSSFLRHLIDDAPIEFSASRHPSTDQGVATQSQ